MVHEVNEAEVAEAKEEVEALDIGTHQAHLNKLKEVHMVVWVPIVVVEAKEEVEVLVIGIHQVHLISIREVPVDV